MELFALGSFLTTLLLGAAVKAPVTLLFTETLELRAFYSAVAKITVNKEKQ
jgi:uncharacterized membrane protein YraQ (UPF0718 family)